MNLWAIAAVLALALVLAWSWLEPKEGAVRSIFRDVSLPIAFARAVLFVVLTIAVHAAIDPDHDHRTFELHLPQIARAAYAFAVTITLLVAFPTLRIVWGAAAVVLAVAFMEALQAGPLPGKFHSADALAGLLGVAAAAGPMWLGAHRARENMARETAARLDAAASAQSRPRNLR